MAPAGVFSALRVKGTPLADEKFLFPGAGGAATGIAGLTVAAMVAQGIDEAQARQHSRPIDAKGLAARSRAEDMMALVKLHVYDPHYQSYA